jgi:hypothetical protein
MATALVGRNLLYYTEHVSLRVLVVRNYLMNCDLGEMAKHRPESRKSAVSMPIIGYIYN